MFLGIFLRIAAYLLIPDRATPQGLLLFGFGPFVVICYADLASIRIGNVLATAK